MVGMMKIRRPILQKNREKSSTFGLEEHPWYACISDSAACVYDFNNVIWIMYFIMGSAPMEQSGSTGALCDSEDK